MATNPPLRQNLFARFVLPQVTVPLPLIPKARPRVTEKGTYMPKGYMRCRNAIAALLISALNRSRPQIVEVFGTLGWPKDASYGIGLVVTVHKSTDGDVDGFVGTVMDAGNGLVWVDDRQIAHCEVEKTIVAPGVPRQAFVRICVYDETGFEPKTRAQAGQRVTVGLTEIQTMSIEQYRKRFRRNFEIALCVGPGAGKAKRRSK